MGQPQHQVEAPPSIPLASVRLDGGTQSRTAISDTVVAEYADLIREGAELPPIVVFHDGSHHWLADGFHRVLAFRRLERTEIAATVNVGTKRDALLHSVGANTEHGLRRTSADKRHAVKLLLTDAEWALWSDHEIARRCGVSHPTVGDLRRSLVKTTSEKPAARTFTTKYGTVTTMNTTNIGRKDSVGRDYIRREPASERATQIETLAKAGNCADQIAQQIGISEERIKHIAAQFKITLPDQVKGSRRGLSRRFDNRRVIQQTVAELDAAAASLRTLGISTEGIEPEEAKSWAVSIFASIKVFQGLRTKLLENANG